jgi:hypothetical protein
MDATLQPARRLIARLLQQDATFFREHHYLDPLGMDDSDQPLLQFLYVFVCGTREFLFSNSFVKKIYSQSVFYFGSFTVVFYVKTRKLE